MMLIVMPKRFHISFGNYFLIDSQVTNVTERLIQYSRIADESDVSVVQKHSIKLALHEAVQVQVYAGVAVVYHQSYMVPPRVCLGLVFLWEKLHPIWFMVLVRGDIRHPEDLRVRIRKNYRCHSVFCAE